MSNAKVYMFYNAEGIFELPNGNCPNWRDTKGHDGLRMAMSNALSWSRQGWNVEWIKCDPYKTGFKFPNFFEDSIGGYPRYWYNIWFAIKKVAPCFVVTADVYNNYFKPPSHGYYDEQYTNFQEETDFSCAFFHVTEKWCDYAIKTIQDSLDRGTYKQINCDVIADEQILRQFASRTFVKQVPIMKYYRGDFKFTSPLVHFGRSTLKAFKFQTVCAPIVA